MRLKFQTCCSLFFCVGALLLASWESSFQFFL